MDEGPSDCARMELADEDVAVPAISQSPSQENIDTDRTSASEMDCHSSINGQEDPESNIVALDQEAIDFRMQQLLTRRFLLQKMKERLKTEERSSDTIEESDEDQSELKAIQNELEELENNRKIFKVEAKTGQTNLPVYKHSPRGGVYTLPPLAPDHIQTPTVSDASEANAVVPVENLGRAPEATVCPNCTREIITKTQSKIGETAWLLCFLCFLLGFVAGCCLIPFWVKRFRNVRHVCPHCHAEIHTYQPF